MSDWIFKPVGLAFSEPCVLSWFQPSDNSSLPGCLGSKGVKGSFVVEASPFSKFWTPLGGARE